MAETTLRTLDAILDGMPSTLQETRVKGPNGYRRFDEDLIRGLTLKAAQGVTRVETGLVAGDETTASTITVYRTDISAGTALVDAKARIIAAAADQKIVGAGAWAKSYKVDGTDAVVLSADGKTYQGVMVAINDTTGNASLHCVFGAEADDGDEAEPTLTQIRTALAAGATGWGGKDGLVVARFKIQRVATDSITTTHTAPTTDSDLATERLAGSLFDDA